jgi:glycerol-3-phosphate dehydrogenase
MKVAVIGGGINGVMTAWALAIKGTSVDLFEQGRLMGATSSASTKLLHGGLRYLEQGHLKLVREALHERRWWMIRAPHLAKPIRMMLPVYKGSGRPAWVVGIGLTLYDRLAGGASLGAWEWRSREDILGACAGLRSDGLQGAFSFYDGQMDDYALGLWAAEKAREAGVAIRTETKVQSISSDAVLVVDGNKHRFDSVVNVAGPWAKQLLEASSIPSMHDLDLVRGSHLLIDCECESALLVQASSDGRICFILPYQGKTLVGSTEVRQGLDEPILCNAVEASYLQELFNYYFPDKDVKVCGRFAGLRPLIRSHANPNKATREYVIETSGKIVSVFGGKWTTARALGLRVADIVTSSL